MTKKEEKKVMLVTQELKIARALAGNDKVIRNRALKSLKKWFHHRSQNIPFTEEDFLRLWKGLFYSMWMSDKPLIQEECAENISSLLFELPLDHSLVFFKCGLLTLVNEWFGIDQLRLDKFMMFVRRFLRQGLVTLKKNGFKKKTVMTLGDIFSCTVLDPNNMNCIGLFMHFTEIFLEELAKVSEGNLDPDLVTIFITPFIKCLAVSEDPRISHIRKFIFVYLLKQSDVGLEYQEKYNAWKRAGFPGSIHSMQKIEADDNDEAELSPDVAEDEQEHSGDKPLDPRAGRVDVELPQIKFNAKAIANILLKHKYVEGTTVAARKAISSLAKQFNIVARGLYPLGVTSLKLPKSEVKDMKIKKAVNRLVKFEKKLLGKDARTLKRKLKQQDKPDKRTKKRKLEEGKQVGNSDSTETDGDIKISLKEKEETSSGLVSVKPKSIKRRKTSEIPSNIFNIDTPLKKKSKELDLTDTEPEVAFERNSGVWFVYHQDESILDTSLDKSCEKLGVFLENKIENLSDSSDTLRKVAVDKKDSPNKARASNVGSSGNRKNKISPINGQGSKLGELKAQRGSLSNKMNVNYSSKEFAKCNLKNSLNKMTEPKINTPSKELFPKSPWDQPLSEGEYEIVVPSKSYVEKLKKISRKSSQNVQDLIDTRLGRSRISLDFNGGFTSSTPQSAKKVKINTKLNQSQEFHEYHSQILSSPMITFDASKKPGKPLLKMSSIGSPVNPFYRKF